MRENSWKFSLAVTIFNFLAFVFVAFAYFFIVVKAKQNGLQKSNGQVHQPRKNKRTNGK